VRWILPEGDWMGEAPLDLAERLGPEAQGPAEPRRVLVVWGEEKDHPILARGRLAVRPLGEGVWCRLPWLLAGRAPWVQAVVFRSGEPALLVIDTREIA
jgi:hypothetical protein